MSVPFLFPERAYIFLDEGGDLNFSSSGTKYFTMTSVAMYRPFPLDAALAELRFDLLESGTVLQCFHACEDRQQVRDRVFALIRATLGSFRADAIIVEKCKTGPSLRADRRFYPEILGYLLRHVVKAIGGADPAKCSEMIVITDRLPIQKKRNAVEKAVKEVLARMLPSAVPYRVLHHESKSCYGLQIADYFNWALYRAWERNDHRSLNPIRSAFASQFDIFARGNVKWY